VAESIVGATMRLSVRGARGRVDLVVPVWAQVGDVARAYAERVGAPDVPTLRRTTGAPLAEDTPLELAGLRHGSLLLAADGPESAGPDREEDGPAEPVDVPNPAVTGWLVELAAVALVLAAAAASAGADGTVRAVTGAVLLAAGLLALVPVGLSGPRRQRLHVAPFCFAGAGFVVAGPAPEHTLLPVAVAALAALAAAGATRALSDDDAVTLVWLWSTGLVSVATTLLLVVGAGPAGLWAVLVAGGVVTVRLLPAIVVDVPDDTLLDLETLAITAWSAHDETRRGRRRPVIRRGEVAELAGRSGVLLRTGTAGATLVLVVGSLLLLSTVDDVDFWTGLGAQVMVGAAVGATALVARGYRDWRLQVLLRVAAAVLAVGLARVVLLELPDQQLLALVAGALAIAAGVVAAAVALGHGWRSVWWARIADMGQGCAFVVALATMPLASGLFGFVWMFTS
jgi:hypothetical protein